MLHAELLPHVSDVLLLQPTSPMRTSEDLEAIVALRQQAERESAVSITPCAKHPAWMYSRSQDYRLQPLVQLDDVDSRQKLPTTYVLNGAMYLASRAFLLREQTFIGPDTLGYVMPVERSVDKHTTDWQWAEFLMEQQHEQSFGYRC